MKLTVTVKGDLEDFVLAQSQRSGKSNAMVVADLAYQGMEYKQSLQTMAVLAAAVDRENRAALGDK